MAKPSTYHSGFNADLLAAIPPDSMKILEFGCGTGALATEFKKLNPRCEYWGVESHVESRDQASLDSGVDWSICADAEDFDPVEESKIMHGHPEPIFQAIVFGDILEHLKYPHQLVKRCVDWLSPNGSVVACIPNIAHWSAVETLLAGHWPQMDSGTFDRTHLRFFTRNSIIEMFEEAGLTISKILPRNLAPGGDRLIEAVRSFGLVDDVDRFRDESQAYQYVVHAVKGDVPSRKVLIRGFPAEACCSRPRLTEPGGMLNTLPGFRYSEVKTQVEPGESVIVVRQRWNIDMDSIKTHLKQGCLVVGEWDDDPWHKGFRGPKLKVFDVEWALKACHAIQVSTEAIAELVRPINPNVAVFPNQIASVGPEREYVESDVVRVYMGGQRKREDWVQAVETVNRIVAADPERYHFVVVHDRELYDALESKHKTFYAFQPYEKYRELLRTCDVAVEGFADTRFSRCKSDITEIECGAESILMLRQWDGWYSPEDLTQPRWSIRSEGRNHRDLVVDNRMLCDHYKKRARWYNGLLDAKPELDRQLFERLPELKEAVG